MRVFDNLYFIGTNEHPSWAVQTSDGLIVIDALFDYAVKDEVVDGLRALGVNPATMKYLIISHGHADHHGGAKFLQDNSDRGSSWDDGIGIWLSKTKRRRFPSAT